MGFFDKIKDIMSATDEDEDYEEAVETSREVPSGNDYYSSSTNRYYEREKTTQFPSERKVKSGSTARVNSQLQVALVKPERFEDAPSVADHLSDGRTVVLNLEVANRETQRRLLDFLSGAAYAHGGRIKKVANSTYIITPSNVDVMGELLLDELDSGSTYF